MAIDPRPYRITPIDPENFRRGRQDAAAVRYAGAGDYDRASDAVLETNPQRALVYAGRADRGRQLEDRQREDAERAQTQTYQRQVAPMLASGDYRGAVSAAGQAGRSPREIMALREAANKAESADVERAARAMGQVASGLLGVEQIADPQERMAAYAQWRAEQAPDVQSKLPPAYSPAIIRLRIAQAREVADVFESEFRNRQQAEVERHNRATEAAAATQAQAAQARAANVSDPFARAQATSDVRRVEDIRGTADRDRNVSDRLNRFIELNALERGTGPGSVASNPVGIGHNSTTQQMRQIISELTPSMREPGSGTTSDFDAKMFQDALPGAHRVYDANRAIVTAWQARAELSGQRAAMAEVWAQNNRSLTGFDEAWRQYVTANPIFDPASSADAPRINQNRVPADQFFGGQVIRSPFSSGGPAQGDVEGGYRFLGGDPADPDSWAPVQ